MQIAFIANAIFFCFGFVCMMIMAISSWQVLFGSARRGAYLYRTQNTILRNNFVVNNNEHWQRSVIVTHTFFNVVIPLKRIQLIKRVKKRQQKKTKTGRMTAILSCK